MCGPRPDENIAKWPSRSFVATLIENVVAVVGNFLAMAQPDSGESCRIKH